MSVSQSIRIGRIQNDSLGNDFLWCIATGMGDGMKSWWEEYPECVEAHENAVKAMDEFVLYLTAREAAQLDAMLDN